MSYSPYIYHEGPLAYVVPQDDSNYYQLQLLEDDGNAGDMAMFDPMIQSHSPPPTQLQSPWTPPQQLQRFIGEKQKTALFNASPSLHLFQNPSLMHGVAPHPPASHRQASPLPLTASSSSTCSIALSPAGESDLNHENTPSTPPDYALTSPSYHTSSPPDMWPPQSQQQQLFFSGMARTSPGDACVNPLDVNSAQDSQFDTFEIDNNALDFSPLQRGFSLQSCSSNSFEVDQPVQLPSELLKAHVSIVEVSQPETKDEIRIPDSRTRVYPGIKASSQAHIEVPDIDADADEDDDHPEDDQTNEDPSLGVEAQTIYLKLEEDSDWQPTKRKRTASKSKPTRSSTKRTASPTPTRPSSKRIKTTAATGSLPKPITSSTGAMKGTFACQDCPRTTFKNEASLMEHRRKQHTRPFVCVFAFAGCESKFAAKNEWKRHVNSQHLLLTYWLCAMEACAKGSGSGAGVSAGPSSSSSRAASTGTGTGSSGCNSTGYSIPSGAVFNRKDLYTQHIRRMHTPPQIKKLTKEAKKAAAAAAAASASSSAGGSKPSSPAAVHDAEQIARWEERLKEYQTSAEKTRCELPTYMSCPAAGCEHDFQGADAWDQRMEHVAKHLEHAGSGGDDESESLGAIELGGDADPTLMGWAANPRVAVVKWSGGKWVLNNPLKDGPLGDVSADAVSAGEITVADEEGDEDAEGEDE